MGLTKEPTMHDHRNQTPNTPGSNPPEPVEDRPNVDTVTPEQYPDRGVQAAENVNEKDKEYERLNPGSGGRTPSPSRNGERQTNG